MTCHLNQPKQRINLDTAHNARDLGGYVTEDGFVTSNRFIRSDCLTPLSGKDAAALLGLGVRTVIDLRHPQECEKVPSRLAEYGQVKYISLPLFTDNGSTDWNQLPAGFTMGSFYIGLLDHSHQPIRAFFGHAAEAQPGRILFHCSAGKDRTGLLAALLLKLSGVSDAAIVQDYALTEFFLAKMLPQLKENSGIPALLGNIVDELLGSAPANMELLLPHLQAKYGDIRSYLRLIGVSEHEIDAVRKSMLEEEKPPVSQGG